MNSGEQPESLTLGVNEAGEFTVDFVLPAA